MKIQITKCSGPLYWYKYNVGEVYDFVNFHESGSGAIHIGMGYLVDLDDYEFIVLV